MDPKYSIIKGLYCTVKSKLAQERSVIRLTDHLDMTIPVDWDVKQQTKQTKEN